MLMLLCSADFRFKNVFGNNIRGKLALRRVIPFASAGKVHIPRIRSPVILMHHHHHNSELKDALVLVRKIVNSPSSRSQSSLAQAECVSYLQECKSAISPDQSWEGLARRQCTLVQTLHGNTL